MPNLPTWAILLIRAAIFILGGLIGSEKGEIIQGAALLLPAGEKNAR
jgi:hypothetical protein